MGKSSGSRFANLVKQKYRSHTEAEGNKRFYSLLPTSKPCPTHSWEASVHIEVVQEDKQ